MKLHCPHCGVKGSAEDSYSGRKIKCPKCQGMFELQPEMALEATEDAASLSALSSIPSDPPATPDDSESLKTDATGGTDITDVELPDSDLKVDVEEDGGESSIDAVAEIEDTDEIPLDEVEETPDEIPLEEDEESISEEDELGWDDIASESDLELTEDDLEDEDDPQVAGDDLEDDPAALSFLDDVEDDEDVAVAGTEVEEPEEVSAEDIDQEVEVAEALEEDEVSIDLSEESSEDDLFDTEALEEDLAEVVAESDSSEEADVDLEAEAVAALAEFNESNDVAAVDELVESAENEDSSEDRVQEQEEDGVELEPYGIDEEECWQCGKKDASEAPFVEKDGRLYCTDCFPVEEPGEPEELSGFGSLDIEEPVAEDIAVPVVKKFAIGDFISKAWAETKGAKGVIWAGTAIMYLVILVIVAGSAFIMPAMGGEQFGLAGPIVSMLFQFASSVFSVLFTAGLFYMGIKKVAGEPISWKMIFRGFSCAGKIIFATILQWILVTIGFLLLVLPGIYLVVGYSMVLPLIVDKGLSPWKALETSRKAIHKVWWRITGLYLLMLLIIGVSTIPLGIGLIWTWPMFIILTGVVYCHLFRNDGEVEAE